MKEMKLWGERDMHCLCKNSESVDFNSREKGKKNKTRKKTKGIRIFEQLSISFVLDLSFLFIIKKPPKNVGYPNFHVSPQYHTLLRGVGILLRSVLVGQLLSTTNVFM